jgi:hypothetical protein
VLKRRAYRAPSQSPTAAPAGGDVILCQTEASRTRLQVRLGLAAPTARFNSSPGQRPGYPNLTTFQALKGRLKIPTVGSSFQGLDNHAANYPKALPWAAAGVAPAGLHRWKSLRAGVEDVSWIVSQAEPFQPLEVFLSK